MGCHLILFPYFSHAFCVLSTKSLPSPTLGSLCHLFSVRSLGSYVCMSSAQFWVDFYIRCMARAQLYFFPSVLNARVEGLALSSMPLPFLSKIIWITWIDYGAIWLHWCLLVFIHLPLCWYQKSGNVRYQTLSFFFFFFLFFFFWDRVCRKPFA